MYEQLVDTIADEIIATLSAARISLGDIAAAILEEQVSTPAHEAMKSAFRSEGYDPESEQISSLIAMLVSQRMQPNVVGQMLATKRYEGGGTPDITWFIEDIQEENKQ
tara:strand:+ start:75 stop:398 length:324 start_codon:yes stop_codon:yes gene_type:complete